MRFGEAALLPRIMKQFFHKYASEGKFPPESHRRECAGLNGRSSRERERRLTKWHVPRVSLPGSSTNHKNRPVCGRKCQRAPSPLAHAAKTSQSEAVGSGRRGNSASLHIPPVPPAPRQSTLPTPKSSSLRQEQSYRRAAQRNSKVRGSSIQS